jgi:hypothetical protein
MGKMLIAAGLQRAAFAIAEKTSSPFNPASLETWTIGIN